MVRKTHPTEDFSDQLLMGVGPPVKAEKVVLTGGTAFPGCADLTWYFGTGWKACATDLKKFSDQNLATGG
jgi:hypothetical protein